MAAGSWKGARSTVRPSRSRLGIRRARAERPLHPGDERALVLALPVAQLPGAGCRLKSVLDRLEHRDGGKDPARLHLERRNAIARTLVGREPCDVSRTQAA